MNEARQLQINQLKHERMQLNGKASDVANYTAHQRQQFRFNAARLSNRINQLETQESHND